MRIRRALELLRRDPRRLAARLLLGSSAQLSYSQEGEDRVLQRLLEDHPGDGFFVDVGAHHPTRFSNTYLLYLSGWRGVNVEPRPGAAREFAKVRPRDRTIEAGVSTVPGELTFYLFSDPALNTFSADRAAFLETTTTHRRTGAISVPVMPLAEILRDAVPAGVAIDVLSIDTEGWDLEVLRSNDWARHSPRLVIVEDIESRSLAGAVTSPIGSFLAELGYQAIARTFNSVIFTRSKGNDAVPPGAG